LRTFVAIAVALVSCRGSETADETDTGDPDTDTGTETDSDTDTDTADPPPPPILEDDTILLYVVADTLGHAAATQGGWCARLQGLLGGYGLDLACIDGGLAPSSWTGESHVRMLFPQHLDGALRANLFPQCGEPSVLADVRAETGATYVFAAENNVLAAPDADCGDGTSSWSAGADAIYTTTKDTYGMALLPEEQKPAHDGISEILAVAPAGGVVALLNVMESGGHQPRCWMDPTTPACDALWQIAVAAGLASDTDDRAATWRSSDFVRGLERELTTTLAAQEMTLRPHAWDSMMESIAYQRDPLFDARLVRVLDGLSAQGRLDDVVIVIVSDHGENPCVGRWFDDTLNCAHGGIATEWTAGVPVYVSPAWLAEEWVARGFLGDADAPWSTANVAYAIENAYGMNPPADWAPMEAPGAATVWTCKGTASAARGSGVRVAGAESLRCVESECAAFGWMAPPDVSYVPTEITGIPASVADYSGSPNWFEQACSVE
jgi:hypothetical protein